jgi:hypothetical protein
MPGHLVESSSHSTSVPSHLQLTTSSSSSPVQVPQPLRVPTTSLSPRNTFRPPAGAPLRVPTTNLSPRNSFRPPDELRLDDRFTAPLRLSPRESVGGSSGDSAADSDVAYSSRASSKETAPTLVTMSAQSSMQPLVADPYTNKEGKRPASLRAYSGHARHVRADSASDNSLTRTPPRLYQPPSADSIVRDFAYNKMRKESRAQRAAARSQSVMEAATTYGHHGAAAEFYGDYGESVAMQPGVRNSLLPDSGIRRSVQEGIFERNAPVFPEAARNPGRDTVGRVERGGDWSGPAGLPRKRTLTRAEMKRLEPVPTRAVPQHHENDPADNVPRQRRRRGHYRPHVSDFFENSYEPPTSSATW